MYRQLMCEKRIKNNIQWGKHYLFNKWFGETLLPDPVALQIWTHSLRAFAILAEKHPIFAGIISKSATQQHLQNLFHHLVRHTTSVSCGM